MISAEVQPQAGRASDGAMALQRLGFRILHIGPTISVQAPRALWESTFGVEFESAEHTPMQEVTDHEIAYLRKVEERIEIPGDLQLLILNVMFAVPPEFF